MSESLELKYPSLVLGSLIVSTGFALVGVNTFRNRPSIIFIGFLLFALGYKTAWYGTHKITDLEKLKRFISDLDTDLFHFIDKNLGNFALLFLGVAAASHGTALFGRLVEDFQLYEALLSGVLCTSGYMLAHEGVNEVLI